MGNEGESSPDKHVTNKRLPRGFVEHQWKPGQSGNPKGRPKRPTFEELVAQAVDRRFKRTKRTKREEIARVFVEEMLARQAYAIKAYLEREWPADNVIKVGNLDGDPLVLELREALGKLPSDRIEQLVEIGERLLQ